MAEDQIAEWHHQVNRQELEQTLGDSEGQGSLVCCSPWDHKESDMTYRLKNDSQIKKKKETAGHMPSKLSRHLKGHVFFSPDTKVG